MDIRKASSKILSRQNKLLGASIFAGIAITVVVLMLTTEKTPDAPAKIPTERFDIVSKDVNPGDVRLMNLETISDVLTERMQSLEKSLIDVKEEKGLVETEKNDLMQQTQRLQEQVQTLETQLHKKDTKVATAVDGNRSPLEEAPSHLRIWEVTEAKEDRHVLFEIPAGSVVKAVLVSGADCSVAVQKPTGPNMVLLRPLDNGKLPRKVRVPLKGSVIIGNAIGDLSSERVYVRAERMTLVESDGSFVETEVSAYISGEDGREGLRGVVVDRSGQIITRAAFAAFLQGVGQTLEATLNNQTIEKLAGTNRNKTILDIDLYRNSALQGGSTALNKMAEYYIKRAEQLQPAIQIAAGRVVDVIFTKTVKIGESDLKKKITHEREIKMREKNS